MNTFLAIFGAAAATLAVGFVWYHPKVFGTAWMREAKLTEEDFKGANMVLTFGVTFVYGILIAFVLQWLVIHQTGAEAAANNIPADPSILENYMNVYGSTYRTFKHGMLHGFIAGLFLALPMVGISALFERRSFKYTLISGGYWVVTFMIMGGILCAWA